MKGFWTKDVPTKEGYYYYLSNDLGAKIEICRVIERLLNAKPVICFTGFRENFYDTLSDQQTGRFWSEPIELPPLAEDYTEDERR